MDEATILRDLSRLEAGIADLRAGKADADDLARVERGVEAVRRTLNWLLAMIALSAVTALIAIAQVSAAG